MWCGKLNPFIITKTVCLHCMKLENIRQAEIPPTPEVPLVAPKNALKQRICFECLLTTEDAVALREFFLSRNIEFKKI